MKTVVFYICLLGGLGAGASWLKTHYQEFVTEGINRFAPKKDDEQNLVQKRNTEEYDAEEEERERKELEEANANAAGKFVVKFTQEANVQKVQKGADKYQFSYIFRDTKEKGVLFQWEANKKLLLELPKRFGLPKDFFSGKYTQAQVDELQRKGSFRQANVAGKQFTVPDYNKIAIDNKPVTLPVYKMLRQYLGNNTTPTKLIEALMVFCQDIPYKRPPASRNNKYIGEMDVPAKMLTVGTGDCDTKSVFFASVLLHQPNIKVAVVLVDNPSHMFAAFRGVPTPYQAYITYQGEKYIVCEPVGNARLPVGQLGFKECKTKMVVKILPK